ncbi:MULTISPECIES: FxsA family protein [Actinoalloteichus]|uniref:UPF0716 protein FxsA n=1 Tax=Actinoalloteichus caeruleus DSM 43889 TaxID=1120930 RepID=A0ABT1JC50_ACTCY|nr:FxsA family protein [Actinoalloteichus caeruleus]MCP2330069.1 UPF0716 protein FxsA [Actinoalloteichus caeruleus DSM 43889]
MPFLLLAILEIATLILVGNAIGVLPTLLLVVAGSIGGGLLLRHESTKAVTAVQEAVRRKAPPEGGASATAILAAIMLLVPGLLTSFLGLVLLLPPVRAVFRRRLLSRRVRFAQNAVRFASRTGHHGASEGVVEGEVVDVDDSHGRARPAGGAGGPESPRRPGEDPPQDPRELPGGAT